MADLSYEEWEKHWNDPATDEEIARWRRSARYEMEHTYTHAEMDKVYPSSRGILRILSRYDRLQEAQDILWDRAHDRGVAIERARDRLHALVGHHGGSAEIDAELRAIADALWASMQDAVPADTPRKGGE